MYATITTISKSAKTGPSKGMLIKLENNMTTVTRVVINPITIIDAGITIVNNHPKTKTTNINLNDFTNNTSVLNATLIEDNIFLRNSFVFIKKYLMFAKTIANLLISSLKNSTSKLNKYVIKF